jgi:ADP-ribose pyrophosphatase
MDSEPLFQIIAERTLLRARFFSVTRQHLLGPGGDGAVRDIVHHPGSVVIVPRIGDEIVFLRMFRAPVGEVLLELPAGKIDVPGEQPEETARRECREEIGFDPGRTTVLFRFFNSPGYTDELTHVVLADDLQPVAAAPMNAEERAAEIVRLDLGAAADRVRRGEIVDAKTLLGLAAIGVAPGE